MKCSLNSMRFEKFWFDYPAPSPPPPPSVSEKMICLQGFAGEILLSNPVITPYFSPVRGQTRGKIFSYFRVTNITLGLLHRASK